MPPNLRVQRLRKTKTQYSPSVRGVKMTRTNYNVHRKKALQQKLDATERAHLTCEFKCGNLVLTFSTAAFGAFRNVLKGYADHCPFVNYKIDSEIRCSSDAIVTAEEAYSARKDEKQQYKVNLYLTTSHANVNGSNLGEFINTHFSAIVSDMRNYGNFDELNDILRDNLQDSLKSVTVETKVQDMVHTTLLTYSSAVTNPEKTLIFRL